MALFDKSFLTNLRKFSHRILQGEEELIKKTHVITNEKINDIDDDIIFDSNSVIHKCYHIKKPALLILRPDNYIAYCSENLEYIFIERFFQRYLY